MLLLFKQKGFVQFNDIGMFYLFQNLDFIVCSIVLDSRIYPWFDPFHCKKGLFIYDLCGKDVAIGTRANFAQPLVFLFEDHL